MWLGVERRVVCASVARWTRRSCRRCRWRVRTSSRRVASLPNTPSTCRPTSPPPPWRCRPAASCSTASTRVPVRYVDRGGGAGRGIGEEKVKYKRGEEGEDGGDREGWDVLLSMLSLSI